jgi:hypothetical protein
MSAPGQRLNLYHSTYVAALHEYLREPSEGSLTVAYELGRAAVTQQLSVLDVAVAYHRGLHDALSGASAHAEWTAITHDAEDFFLESLASFEMLHRGAAETRNAVDQHRHRAQLSRQLSTFLTDSSLALRSTESMDEMLQLAVDQGREILGAGCCLVTVAAEGEPRAASAVSRSDPDADWAFTRWLDLPRLYRLLEQSAGLLELTREPEALSVLPATLQPDQTPTRWLAVSLTALDGTQIGALQAFDTAAGAFDSEGEAALIHLAQMISATVERMRLYGQTATSTRG